MEPIYVPLSTPNYEPRKLPFLVEFLVNVSTAVVIFLVIYFFVAQPHQVEGSSMLPNYFSGDYVLTEKITERFSGINRADVVVFRYPKNPSLDYIKRVIALPGDKVLLKDGFVYINDEVLDESYLAGTFQRGVLANEAGKQVETTLGSLFLKEGQEYELNEGEIVVMGDNRNESSDSREWGPVSLDNVVGKVFFRYWPLSRIGFVNSY